MQVPVVIRRNVGQRGVRFGQHFIDLQGLQGCGLRLGEDLDGGVPTVKRQDVVVVGHPGVGRRVARILADCLSEIRKGLCQPCGCPFVPEVAAQQVRFMRCGVDWAGGLQARLLLRRELDLDFMSDGPCDLALQREHVSQVPLVRLGPYVAVGCSFNQLRRDPHPVARLHYRPLHHKTHVQLLSDFRERLADGLVLHHRPPGDHAERTDLGQVSNEGFGHAVYEILLAWVAREIIQRQHRQRFNPGWPGNASAPASRRVERPPACGCQHDGDRHNSCRARAASRRRPCPSHRRFGPRCRALRAHTLEGFGKLIRRGKPVGGVPGQRPSDHLVERVRHRFPYRAKPRHRICEFPCLNRLRRRPGEGRLPRQHLVQDAAKGVHVGATVHVFSASQLLGAHVGGRPDREARRGELLPARCSDGAGDAEVADHRMSRLEENVLRLDVAMHDVMTVGVGEGVGHFASDLHSPVQRELRFSAQALAQRLALHVWHDVVREAVSLARVVKRDDVRVGQGGGDFDLPQETVGAHSRGELRMKDFDCYGSTVLEILREINDGHPPAAELALDRVAPRQGGLKASQLVDHNSIIGPALGRARGMSA